MDCLQEKFDVFMQFSEQQLSRADTVINLFVAEGLLRPSTISTDVKHSPWKLGRFLKPKRKPVDKQADYDPASAFLLRYQVAQLLADLSQLADKEYEVIDHLRSMMAKAKPKVQVYFHNDDEQAIPALQFNYTLSRFTYLVFSRWIVNDSPELNQIMAKLETESQVDGYLPAAVGASDTQRSAESVSDIVNRFSAESDERTEDDLIEGSLISLTDQVNGEVPGFDLFIQKSTASQLAGSNESLFTSFGTISHPDQLTDEFQVDEIVSNNQLHTYSRDQYLDRLKLPDSELLSSLPTREVKVCPACFGRSLVERKRPVNDLTTYCQTCRTRVETVYGPYYYQSYTANPAIAIIRHRQFLVDRLRIRYFAPEVPIMPPPPTQPTLPPASKTYFFSISAIDEETYKGLEAKYNEFMADYAQRVSFNRVTPDRVTPNRVTIQICSLGGNVFQAKRLIGLINSHKNYTTVTGDVLYSAAFRLYFSLNCPKSLASHAVGMFHLARTVEYVLESGKVVDWPAQNQSEESLAFCRSLGLNDPQIATIAAGGDVYFSRIELEQLDKQRGHQVA